MTYQSKPPLPTEFALAIECCRRSVTDPAKVHQLAARTDWHRFLALCERHRIQGLAWRAVRLLDLAPPAEVADALAAQAGRIAHQGLLAASLSDQFLHAFGKADIPILFLKGLTVSRLAYDDPFVKMSNDLDFLVPLAAVERAGALLEEAGFARTLPRRGRLAAWHAGHKESVWVRDGCPPVELHTRLSDNQRLIPALGNESPVQQVAITPDITLPTLARDELMAYLCVHGASSAWFRLKWIADFAGLLAPYDRPGIDRLIRFGDRAGAGRAVPAALLLCHRLFGTILASATVGELSTLANRLLARIAHRELHDPAEPTQQPLGTMAIHLSQLLLLPGASFKGAEAARQVGSALSRG